MPQDDSDMKIAPNDLSEVFDSSEGAANAYLRETQNGNMEKARKLGRQFADELMSENPQGILLFGVGAFDTDETLGQRKILFSYIVGKVIEDIAPNSMVAQSAISAFYEKVKAAAPALHDMITDSAIYSMYMLSARNATEDPHALGRVFARLCGKEADKVFTSYGCELAAYFTMYCRQVALRIQMIR